ncbi:MAG: glycosyltransferase family 2 protein [Pyrinomonadaceae bacterium]
MSKSLSIIVPAYNEEARLGKTVRKILELVEDRKLNAELIVIDDGSTDSTSDVAKQICAEFPGSETSVIRYDENRGKGFAVKTGMISAQGEIVLFSDADLSTPIEEYEKLVSPIENGEFDVTFGSRALDRSLIGEHQPWRREQGGKIFNFFVRTLTGMPFWDTQCGFKAFNMEKFRPLLDKMTIDRFGFDVEFLFAAHHKGLRLKEIPVRWNNDERTKVNIFRDSIRMFGEVREIRRNSKKGLYS